MIEEIIDSPFNDGKATLNRKPGKFPFRRDEFEIVEHFYVCDTSQEEFTTAELDKINLNQVYNQYRKKYGIPFPDHIRQIRQKYGLSASKMSTILGLGPNSYRLYEQGEMPSTGNGRLIVAAEDPSEFRKFLLMSREIIGEKDFERIDKLCQKIIAGEELNDIPTYLPLSVLNRKTTDEYSGYRIPDLDKISHMIMFFSNESNTWITKLNKLLFYCDFLAFKNSGFGITGLNYRAVRYGPVPSRYEEIYNLIDSGDLLKRKFDESGGYEGSYFEPLLTFNELLFDSFEIEIMRKVSETFKYFSATEIKELSHREAAWQENIEQKKLISYKDYGFSLKAI
ncbi:MAG TPA: type II toxin-antitoxin system antitoxin SocA domain-containing protein [Hanamia sp.]|nr:type II toxin-antitoxin system antitoxin SocA domain-containing protein [Hanamia sp.]